MATSSIIDINNVTKRYGDFVAVNDITFSVNKGEIFAFLGPNGAGKSTTIKMLTTLLRPTSGKILLNGHDVSSDPSAARKSFGIVFQDSSVDSELTAYENMELHAVLYGIPADQIKPRAYELLELLELKDRANDYVKTFSGGMIRRLEIARGLLHQPQILFLDEPTLGLDTQTRNLLWEYVTKLSRTQDMTVFLTTHYIEEAEMVSHRIAIIDHGTIIAIGSAKELKAKTHTDTLEQAYLALTGKAIREEQGNPTDQFRARMRSRQRR